MPRVANRFSAHAPLDPTSIARAALHVIDTEGLDKLTMRRLGTELGVEAMSIYHHVPNKAAVLELVIAQALAPAQDFVGGPDPVDTIEQIAHGMRDVLLAHPNLVPLVTAQLPQQLLEAKTVAGFDRLVEFGFDEQAATWILDSFVGYVLGLVVLDVSGAGRTRADADAAFESGLRFLLAGLRDELGL